jgi:hypothetical protein
VEFDQWRKQRRRLDILSRNKGTFSWEMRSDALPFGLLCQD